MKTITRTKIYLPMAAMILTMALAIPAVAQNQVAFKGATGPVGAVELGFLECHYFAVRGRTPLTLGVEPVPPVNVSVQVTEVVPAMTVPVTLPLDAL